MERTTTVVDAIKILNYNVHFEFNFRTVLFDSQHVAVVQQIKGEDSSRFQKKKV